MNKTLTTAATLTLGARSYESPAITAVEVFSEGVLCMSGEGSFNDLDDSNYVNW